MNMGWIGRGAMLLVMLASLLEQTGCHCIMDPCPKRARKDYSWTITGHAAALNDGGAVRMLLWNTERLALITGGDGIVRIDELQTMSEGDALSSGGRVLEIIPAEYAGYNEVQLLGAVGSDLYLVRLEPDGAPFTFSVRVYWDIADCDVFWSGDASISDISAVCGDGFVDVDEECDDSNTDSGDGCSECEIDEASCSGAAGESWSYWTCEGEPSECELHQCEIGSSDPNCDLLADLDINTITNGLIRAGDRLGRVTSSPPGIDCGCAETAISYECSATCSMDVPPCTRLDSTAGTGINFGHWADGCAEDACTIQIDTSHVLGIFDSELSGIESEHEYRAYPLEAPGLDMQLMAVGGGVVAAAGLINGEFEDPLAPDVPPGTAPRPFVVGLDEAFDVVWTQELPVGDEDAISVVDVAVDGLGNTLLAVGLYGELTLDAGTVTVESVDHAVHAPPGLVLIKLSPLGEHLWSQLVVLPEEYALVSARLATRADGMLSLAAVVDYEFHGVDSVFDLVVASLTADGEVTWLQPLRLAEDREPGVIVNELVATAIDNEGSVFLVGGTTGAGPFQYVLPEDTDEDGETLFVTKLDGTGAQGWTEPLPTSSLAMLQAAVDDLGRIVVFTSERIVSYQGDSELGWIVDIEPRPYDTHDHPSEPLRSFSLHPVSGEFVIANEASTTTHEGGTDEHFLALVTSRFDAEGQHLWTVRRESVVAGELFQFRAVSVQDADVIVLGRRFLPVAEHNDSMVLRRLATAP